MLFNLLTMMDLKDRSLRRLNSKSLRRDGFKVFSSKLLIALNNAEQQKALARTTNQPNLSPRSFVASLFLFPFFGRIKFLSFVVTFRMKNLIFVSLTLL